MNYTYDSEYLKSKKVTFEDCIIVIETTDFHYLDGFSDYGNMRIMYVGKPGPDRKELEVGVEFFEEDEELGIEQTSHIYHAMNALKETKRKAGYED